MKLLEIIQIVEANLVAGDNKSALNAINYGLIMYPRNVELIQLYSNISIAYDDDFFNSSSNETYKSAQKYLEYTNQFYDYQTVADVGAGLGSWSKAAKELGKGVVSFDGDWVQKINQNTDLDYIYCDLNNKIPIDTRFDLAICVEVAEHLRPERSTSFIKELCSLSDVIIFGAALPRQGGVGHINCRPHSFWIDIFKDFGYRPLDAYRPRFFYHSIVAPYYAQNTYLFCTKDFNKFKFSFPEPTLVDVYHPKVVLDCPIIVSDHLNAIVDPGLIQN